MKLVGVVTLYDNVNYGNRLQNYAVVRYFAKNGIVAETVVKKASLSFRKTVKSVIKKAIVKFLNKPENVSFLEYTRRENFAAFSKRYIPTRFYKKTIPNRFLNRYELFVVGSDQVWNPCFGGYEKFFDEMFLMGVPNHKKACFAPSFGVSAIPKEWHAKFTDALNSFPKLSAREQAGVDIIKDLTGKDAFVMIDPTLMLDSTEWLEVAHCIDGLPDQYVLDYFLGETPSDQSYHNVLLGKYGTERIRLLDVLHRDIYVSGPAEFIYLVSKSSLICTDSFHACVFAILFDKPFSLFKRIDSENNMFSRLRTLLGLFSIDVDKLESGEIIHIDPILRDEVLARKREEVRQYFFEPK